MACHQTTGQCGCKANAHGLKCDECKHGFYHLNKENPKGCQECFGYGHLSSCMTAIGFLRSYVVSQFQGKFQKHEICEKKSNHVSRRELEEEKT